MYADGTPERGIYNYLTVPVDYSWSGLAAWYLKAIDAAGIRNFHLVVHDIGGGFDVIRRVPDRIKSLTVLNTLVDVSQFQRPWVMEPF